MLGSLVAENKENGELCQLHCQLDYVTLCQSVAHLVPPLLWALNQSL